MESAKHEDGSVEWDGVDTKITFGYHRGLIFWKDDLHPSLHFLCAWVHLL